MTPATNAAAASRSERSGDEVGLRSLAAAARRVGHAYAKLQRGAARLDRELSQANRTLEQKVVELEHLSGSLAAVLAAIPCGVVVADRGGTVVMANPAAQRILDVTADRLLGRNTRRSDAVLRGETPALLLAKGDGEHSTVERIVDTRDGARVVRGSVVAVKDAAGAFLGRVELLDDRTEVKALEEEVRRLDRLAELGRVAAILAHEIRNPLSGIRGFAGMLERRIKESEGREDELRFARRICEGAERADAIIDSVLFLASPRPLKREAVDVQAMLCDCFERVAHAEPARARGVHVAIDVAPRGLAVAADRVRLEQAISNLLGNALHALDGKGRVDLTARVGHGMVAIGVRDDGPGIDDATQARVFEPFFTTKSDGAGLGLALVRRVAELHGGRIELKSRPGKGATFTLLIPEGPEVPEGRHREHTTEVGSA